MAVAPSKVPLQKLIKWLPKPMRRIKVAQFFASIIGAPYHLVAFPEGNLVGNVRDAAVANSLIKGAFEDYGYFELARCILQNGCDRRSAGHTRTDVPGGNSMRIVRDAGFPNALVSDAFVNFWIN